MKFTRKVGQAALAGAIAFGGLSLGAVMDVPVPGLKSKTASAASNLNVLAYDLYDRKDLHFLTHNVDSGGKIDSVITKPSFTNGGTLGGIVKGTHLFTSEQVKLYEITKK